MNGNTDSVITDPDELVVDFLFADAKEPYKALNPKESDWNRYPTPDGSTFTKGEPPFVVWGGGGKKLGYSVDNQYPALSITKGIYPDIYDVGMDEEFHFVYLPLPKEIFAGNRDSVLFRFRIRINALNNRSSIISIPDDEDNAIIANVKLLNRNTKKRKIDFTVEKTLIDLPYTLMPKSQAASFPVKSRLRNVSCYTATDVKVITRVWLLHPNAQLPEKGEYYYSEQLFNAIPPFQSRELNIDDLNLHKLNEGIGNTPNGIYEIKHTIIWRDSFGENTKEIARKLRVQIFGDEFAYDTRNNPRNDVSDASFSGVPGRGLNLFAYSEGHYKHDYAYGYTGGSGSGELAMRFELKTKDTITGYIAYWGAYKSFDDIAISLYRENGEGLPGSLVPGSIVKGQKGWDDFDKDNILKIMTKYKIYQPIELEPGAYWMAILQMGQTGIALAGSKIMTGMATTVYSDEEPYGSKGMSLFINRRFREVVNGEYKGNKNLFAYINHNIPDSRWISFSPTVGNPGYAHLDHSGLTPADNFTKTYSRGTFIPMIRPYFGKYHLVTSVGDIDWSSNKGLCLSFMTPNPAESVVQIGYEISYKDRIRIEIFDLRGNAVLQEIIRDAIPGSYSETFRVDYLIPRIYFVTIKSSIEAVFGKLAIIK